MSAALGLHRAGWRPVVVERAPGRRPGGYFVGLFPPGKDAAKAVGIYDDIHVRTPRGGDNWDVRPNGVRKPSLCFLDQPGNPDALLRGDIEAGLWTNIEDKAEVRFSTVPVDIRNEGDEVVVILENTATGERATERFGLVVGADGMRSSVRRMVFGPDEDYMRPLGAIVCAYELRDQIPGYQQRDSIVTAEAGRALWIFPFEDRPPAAMFTYRTKDLDAQFKRPPVETLRQRFAGMSAGGLLEHALDELERAQDPLFDSVHQVRMKNWSKGRIVLVGDSAWSLTLYSGMGATMGIMGGAELGKAFAAHGDDVEGALAAFETSLRPVITQRQRSAYIMRELFVPSNGVMRIVRATFIKLIERSTKRKKAKLALNGETAMAESTQPA